MKNYKAVRCYDADYISEGKLVFYVTIETDLDVLDYISFDTENDAFTFIDFYNNKK
jgi:hypothetical protein